MKFVISGLIFKKIIDAVKDLVKDTSIEFSKDGFTLNAMDSSHVSLVYLNINTSLSEYMCEQDEVISLSTETLYKILKTCDNNSTLTCQNNNNKLEIVAHNDDRYMNFSQNLLDLESDAMMIPNIEYPCKIIMSCGEFQKICRDMREFGEDIRIMVSPNNLKLSTANGGEHMDIEYNIDKSNLQIESEASIEICFSLKYLCLFCKATPLCDNVTLFIGVEQPIQVKFAISESEHLSFFLAPKID